MTTFFRGGGGGGGAVRGQIVRVPPHPSSYVPDTIQQKFYSNSQIYCIEKITLYVITKQKFKIDKESANGVKVLTRQTHRLLY